MGRHQAVAETIGIRWRGFPAWFLARTYHLAQMPGTKRKARLVTDWTVGLFFGRDSAELGQLGHPRPLEGRSAGGTGGAGGPGLSAAAFAFVLASAFLHAGWNALVAGARDTHATAAIALLAGTIAFAPVAALSWDVDAAAVPYVAGSAALELAYFALLAAAYARADYTFVYPVARGTAPVLVLVISVAALGAPVGAAAAAGVVAVAVGVLLVRGVGAAAPGRKAVVLALGVGGCIAGYTLIDDRGVNHAAAVPYFEVVLVATALPYAAAVAALRGPAALRAAAGGRAAAAGVGMVAAYVLVLEALERAEAAPVAALRETSVLIAAAGAALAGRERVPPRRMAGAALVVAGIAAIAAG